MKKTKKNRLFSMLISFAIALGMIPATPVLAMQENVNLAKNAEILGVSAASPNDTETDIHAFDGDEHLTKWCIQNNTGWVVFDIGKEKKINELKVYHAGAGTNETIKNNTIDFELQILDQTKISEDKFLSLTYENREEIMMEDYCWKNVCVVENNTDSITDSICTDDTARVYRFHVSNAGEDFCIRIYEIELLGENAWGLTGKVQDGIAYILKIAIPLLLLIQAVVMQYTMICLRRTIKKLDPEQSRND